MGPQFHETGYGKRFFEVQLPHLINSFDQLTEAINENNELSKKLIEMQEEETK